MLGCLTASWYLHLHVPMVPYIIPSLSCPLPMFPNPEEITVTYSLCAQVGDPGLTLGLPLLFSIISNLKSSCYIYLLNPSQSHPVSPFTLLILQFWPRLLPGLLLHFRAWSFRKSKIWCFIPLLKKPFDVCPLFLVHSKHLNLAYETTGSDYCSHLFSLTFSLSPPRHLPLKFCPLPPAGTVCSSYKVHNPDLSPLVLFLLICLS